MNNISNKTVIITGGSQGIGLEISKHLANTNYKIILISRSKDELEKVCNELDGINKLKNFYFVADVSNRHDLSSLENFLSDHQLMIDALINCAGVYGPIGNTLDIDLEEFQKAFNINFFGTLNMIKASKKFFKKAIKKKVINFSGGGAASPFPYYSAYATSKAAIVRLTENLSIELKNDSFDINCIAPGFVITRLHQETIKAGPEKMGKEFYENTKKMIENGGVSHSYSCDLVSFLLSGHSDGITGKFISANWDKWNDKEYLKEIRQNNNFATLRRIDKKFFFHRD
jgi:short-subunit dehydrogenase